MFSDLTMPMSLSTCFSPPVMPAFLHPNLRSKCGESKLTSGKLQLSTGMSKQHPLKVTNIDVPSSACDSDSDDRFSPLTSVVVSPPLTTVTTVTVESLSSPSVSMSRNAALSLKRS